MRQFNVDMLDYRGISDDPFTAFNQVKEIQRSLEVLPVDALIASLGREERFQEGITLMYGDEFYD